MLLGKWAGKWSFRARIGRLWFGANLRTFGFFIIFTRSSSGPIQFLSWNRNEKLIIRALALAIAIATIAYIAQ